MKRKYFTLVSIFLLIAAGCYGGPYGSIDIIIKNDTQLSNGSYHLDGRTAILYGETLNDAVLCIYNSDGGVIKKKQFTIEGLTQFNFSVTSSTRPSIIFINHPQFYEDMKNGRSVLNSPEVRQENGHWNDVEPTDLLINGIKATELGEGECS